MGYTKNTWKTDDIITADRLNAMETGIDGIYNPINIKAGYDFNNLQTAGYYMGSGIFPNSPTPTVSYSYYIDVYTNHQGFITQKVTQYAGGATNVYVRSYRPFAYFSKSLIKFSTTFLTIIILSSFLSMYYVSITQSYHT